MRRMLIAVACVCCTTAAPVPPATPVVAVKPTAEHVAADTRQSTPGGATFTAPAGWSVHPGDSLVILDPPEPDSHVAIVDVHATDSDSAVAAAWKVYKPEAARPLKLATDRPARDGWEEKRFYDYETSPNERKVVEAIAHRAGQSWTVMIIDGSEPTFEKRAAPVNLIVQSLRPKGYHRESFAGRKPHTLDAERLAQVRALVESGMEQLGVPGVGYSLIQDGRVVFEGGAGVRELGKPEKIDANTLFIAASNTKALTTLLLARLVDAKKLSWDQPVTQVYPAFKLGSAETTRQVSIRHLICACTGLPRQD